MDTVFDPLRRTEVALTPEEGVRQSVIQWLHTEVGIPLCMMASEYSFRYNAMQYRADVVVFGRDTKPLLMVECKAPSVRIDRNVVEQGLRYNRVLNVKYMIFTNGSSMYCLRRSGDGPQYELCRELPDIEI
ncbi:MAG TPA: type I restriction enzyme HsdR N-terminal domain-containing protein [Candidatus Coprenecus pullistercoris]|nr:type I restriction enzyme HsdR N-terminal domain-containing protein [Candidatus Coprenecus pullistercoris]